MSGIAVVVDWECPVPQERVVERMLDTVPHRAADGRLTLAEEHCALGYARFGTTPRQHTEVQPLRDAQRDLSVVADVRLDNREELMEALGAHSGASDPELLLRGYEKWGVDLAEHLLGDFALVIWDGKRRELYAARDPFGVRPLFYHQARGRLVLASEVEQILALEGVSRELEDRVILDYLLGRYRHYRETFFRVVSRLVPGCCLVGKGDGVREARYWQPPAEDLRLPRTEDYDEEFRRLFRRAVAARLDADRPIVAQLSGGLDSSSIVCMADRICREGNGGYSPVHVASAVFPGFECDESRYVDAVAQSVNFLCRRYNGAAVQPAAENESWIARPTGAFQLGALVTRKAAAEVGARVLLSGFGGDELLFERGVFRDLAARRRWLALWREASLAPRYSTRSRWFYLTDALRGAAPPRARALYRRVLPRQPEKPPRWLGPALQRVWDETRPEGPPPATLPSHTQGCTWAWLTSADLAWSVEASELLMARVGIQPRFPYLDGSLARFVLRVPFQQRIPSGRLKVLLRRALNGILPVEITRREGVTVFDSLACWCLERHGSALRECLDGPTWLSEPYVSRRAVQELFETLLLRRAASTNETSWGVIWQAVGLEWWLRCSHAVQAGQMPASRPLELRSNYARIAARE